MNQAYAMAIQGQSQRKLALVHKGIEPLTMLERQKQRYSNQSSQGRGYKPQQSQRNQNFFEEESTLRHRIIKERNQGLFVNIVVKKVMAK